MGSKSVVWRFSCGGLLDLSRIEALTPGPDLKSTMVYMKSGARIIVQDAPSESLRVWLNFNRGYLTQPDLDTQHDSGAHMVQFGFKPSGEPHFVNLDLVEGLASGVNDKHAELEMKNGLRLRLTVNRMEAFSILVSNGFKGHARL